MNEIKSTKGITLVALVVTIIVLIILAGVSINLLLGQYGVITKARDAKEATEIARVKEEVQLKLLDYKMGEMLGNVTTTTLEEIITAAGGEAIKDDEGNITGVKVGDTIIPIDEVTKGVEIGNGTTVANAPDINGFNKSNTYYVSWNLTSSPYQINEDTNLNGIAPSNWYDYTEGVNHWANVKTTGGENDCYWVWIPRYAYCITTGYHSNTAGTIDIKFLQGTTNTPIDGSSITISNSSGSGNWNSTIYFIRLKNAGSILCL